MKKSVLLLMFLCFFKLSFAQEQGNSLTGKIIDGKTKEAIEMATIQVLNARDSAYVAGGATNQEGEFKIAVAKGRYILHISYMGYKGKYVNAGTLNTSNLGTILMGEDDVLLKEAIVEAKAIEIQVKGDTVEYNADSYKTQPSAVVEDLLKKMPGVEIDSEGKITINGKEIKKILVDGKEFFSDDPKVASKNLPASMVNKLQVVDRKSDMSQMTGFDDGSEETVINLTVKQGMKQGIFGNAYAGYGSKDRYETNGMVNVMRNNTQITALAGANNTNNAGFTDFASSMGGGNRPRGVSFGGNNGVAKTANGGFNFATDYGDKFKWGGNIRYGSVDNEVTTKKDIQNIGRNIYETSNSEGNKIGDNYATSLKFEWQIDSLTKIIVTPNIQYNKNSNFETSNFTKDLLNKPIENEIGNTRGSSNGDGIKLNGNIDISRKLNNKGRVLSVSVYGGIDNSNSEGFDYSLTHFINNYPTRPDSIIDQKNSQENKGYQWRAFVSYVEPIGRNNFLQLTYNIRNNHSETDKISYSKLGEEYSVLDENFTRNVKNDFINQNISLNFKAQREMYNYTLGMGFEPSSSKTELYIPKEGLSESPRKGYLNYAPNGQFNYLWSKQHNLRVEYRGTTNQASALQLIDGVISRNGMDSTVGNPNLKPSFENRFTIRYQKFNRERGSMLMLRGAFNQVMNDIITITNWSGARKETTYTNINGNWSGNLRFMFNTPLRNKKFSINSMTFGGYKNDNTLINSQKNKAQTINIQENVGIQFRSDKLDFSVRGNVLYNNIQNSISKSSDRSVYNYGGFGSFTLYLPFDFTLDSDMAYSSNSGYGEGYKQNEWLWNASLAKQLFRNKAGTIRFKIYDMLKQRSNISQQSSSESITYTSTNTINSYFMVHFIYKFQLFKGMKREAMEENMQEGIHQNMRQNYGGGRPGSGGGGGGRFF